MSSESCLCKRTQSHAHIMLKALSACLQASEVVDLCDPINICLGPGLLGPLYAIGKGFPFPEAQPYESWSNGTLRRFRSEILFRSTLSMQIPSLNCLGLSNLVLGSVQGLRGSQVAPQTCLQLELHAPVTCEAPRSGLGSGSFSPGLGTSWLVTAQSDEYHTYRSTKGLGVPKHGFPVMFSR